MVESPSVGSSKVTRCVWTVVMYVWRSVCYSSNKQVKLMIALSGRVSHLQLVHHHQTENQFLFAFFVTNRFSKPWSWSLASLVSSFSSPAFYMLQMMYVQLTRFPVQDFNFNFTRIYKNSKNSKQLKTHEISLQRYRLCTRILFLVFFM